MWCWAIGDRAHTVVQLKARCGLGGHGMNQQMNNATLSWSFGVISEAIPPDLGQCAGTFFCIRSFSFLCRGCVFRISALLIFVALMPRWYGTVGQQRPLVSVHVHIFSQW